MRFSVNLPNMAGGLSLQDGRVLATSVRQAKRPVSRMRGLLGRRPLEPGEALLVEPTSQVHTFGMRYPIDVVFCDRTGEILRVVRAMRPWRISPWVRGARLAIELPAGSVPTAVGRGDRVVSEMFSAGSRRAP